LWGGVVGEDGLAGLRLDETSRDGPFFREAQHALKALQSQGVLLAIASRNNPEEVRAVLRDHPKMALREADFVAMEIGWGEKIHSLSRIARDLNLGLESLVFLDDSPFELERVRTGMPQVTCLQVPEAISDYPGVLRDASGLFFNLSETDEDLRRTEYYRADASRKQAMTAFESETDYIASLEVRVEVREGADIDIARAAQLSQKTNQFNLTTHRYTDSDIARLAAASDCIVATFAVSDRFGDYGTTGLVILRLDRGAHSASLDTLLMSCRVLGRRVEDSIFAWIEKRLRAVSVSDVCGEYVPTPKNLQVESLLDRFGFKVVTAGPDGKRYRLDLAPVAHGDEASVRSSPESR
jgi:FkbH-like protein